MRWKETKRFHQSRIHKIKNNKRIVCWVRCSSKQWSKLHLSAVISFQYTLILYAPTNDWYGRKPHSLHMYKVQCYAQRMHFTFKSEHKRKKQSMNTIIIENWPEAKHTQQNIHKRFIHTDASMRTRFIFEPKANKQRTTYFNHSLHIIYD